MVFQEGTPILHRGNFCVPFEANLLLDVTVPVSFLPFQLCGVEICLPRNLSVNCPPS